MKLLATFATALLTFSLRAQQPAPSPVLLAAQAELQRDFTALKADTTPAYYLSYDIADSTIVSVTGSFGTLAHSGASHHRSAHVDVRVGDYALDNTHQVRGKAGVASGNGNATVTIPLDDDPLPIRNALWLETDKRFKKSVAQFATVQTNNQIKVEQEDKSADFSKEAPQKFLEPAPKDVQTAVDRKAWEAKARKYTAPFHQYGDLFNASATFQADQEIRWFVDSNGALDQTSHHLLPPLHRGRSPRRGRHATARGMSRLRRSRRAACRTTPPCSRPSRR